MGIMSFNSHSNSKAWGLLFLFLEREANRSLWELQTTRPVEMPTLDISLQTYDFNHFDKPFGGVL